MRCFWPIQSLFVQIEFIFKFLFILCPLLTKVRHHLVHLVLQENALFPFHPFSYCVFVHCMPSPTALNFTIHLLLLFFQKGSTVSLSASTAFLNLLRKDLDRSKPAILPHCSAQTRTGIGHLRRPPGVELIPCRRKPLRPRRTLRDPAQTQV